ncbi:arginine--tRNA ligase [Paenibacillus sp. DMB20]|uniref:arginine--tRNA ligase n=1 Tax=Paenibacillus sp. DMB20 TaxID=1642570 RepID=UPI00062780E3|nr:arginine--tRNA ligase [Paenibacillus sp. DMB20]KKO51335.1 arginyl-tRNA synthetase [Paenibacillus sp. DMB20]KKO51828.1 arginyl-tRNA synthetase [Paenibacillus sp. DMB20]
MLKPLISSAVEQAVQQVLTLSDAILPDDVLIQIEQPANMDHGDYSTNIAMQLAKILRKAPLAIAGLIKDQLQLNSKFTNLIPWIEVVPPGFINFKLDWASWAAMELEPAPAPVEKVVVEHTSINPNKSAHIGHLRNSCIGDTLVRLLRKNGYRVEVHNYIDDLGNQLADTVVGMLHFPLSKEHHRFGDYCWDIYSSINKAYEHDSELAKKRTEVLHALEEGNQNLSWVGLLVAERIVREHLEEMKQFGIEYDLLVWESSIVKEGFWASAFELLKGTSLFHLETEGKLAGCWVLKQSDNAPSLSANQADGAHPDHSADKVLVRSSGILTYTAKDIAYHLWKYGLLQNDFEYKRFSDGVWTTGSHGERMPFGNGDMVVNVIDYRQQYPQAMVKQALEVLGFDNEAQKLRHVSYGVVSLSPSAAAELGIDTTDGKASYAMSGRQGIGIKITELIDRVEQVIEQSRSDKNGLSSREIAAASIRYYLLRFALQTEVVFDLKQATEISGNTGVYLLYSYARSLSVLNKAQEAGVFPAVPHRIDHPEQAEHALLRHISAWPDVLDAAAQELSPSMLCNYAYELASLFNNFYGACPILKAEGDSRKKRVWLTSLFKDTLGEVLEVLGLPTPSRM